MFIHQDSVFYLIFSWTDCWSYSSRSFNRHNSYCWCNSLSKKKEKNRVISVCVFI